MTCGTFFWSLWISSRENQVVTLGLGDPRIEWLRLMSSLLEELFDTRVFMYQILVEYKQHTNGPLCMAWIDVLGILEGTLPLHINVKFSGVFYHFHSSLLLIMNHFYPTFQLYFSSTHSNSLSPFFQVSSVPAGETSLVTICGSVGWPFAGGRIRWTKWDVKLGNVWRSNKPRAPWCFWCCQMEWRMKMIMWLLRLLLLLLIIIDDDDGRKSKQNSWIIQEDMCFLGTRLHVAVRLWLKLLRPKSWYLKWNGTTKSWLPNWYTICGSWAPMKMLFWFFDGQSWNSLLGQLCKL